VLAVSIAGLRLGASICMVYRDTYWPGCRKIWQSRPHVWVM